MRVFVEEVDGVGRHVRKSPGARGPRRQSCPRRQVKPCRRGGLPIGHRPKCGHRSPRSIPAGPHGDRRPRCPPWVTQRACATRAALLGDRWGSGWKWHPGGGARGLGDLAPERVWRGRCRAADRGPGQPNISAFRIGMAGGRPKESLPAGASSTIFGPGTSPRQYRTMYRLRPPSSCEMEEIAKAVVSRAASAREPQDLRLPRHVERRGGFSRIRNSGE